MVPVYKVTNFQFGTKKLFLSPRKAVEAASHDGDTITVVYYSKYRLNKMVLDDDEEA